MSGNNSNQRKKHGKEHGEHEDTTFIVMVLRPTDPKKDTVDPNLLAVLTGWCVIAAHGIDEAMRHVVKIDLGVDLRDVEWKDIGSNGKMAKLENAWMLQVLPAPLYVVETEEPLIAPPSYIM